MARRINGEGTVYKDKRTGRWIGAVTLDGRRKKVVANTREEASRRLLLLKREHDAGLGVGDGNATLGDAVDVWLARALPARRSGGRPLAPGTREAYEWCAELWRNELGSRRLRALTVNDVEGVLDRLANRPVPQPGGRPPGDNRGRQPRPLGRSALVKMRSVLGMILDTAVRRRLVTHNIARAAELTPAAKRTRRRAVLEPADAARLWHALQSERLGAMYATAMVAGHRPGEIAGALWPDLDLDAGTLDVRHAVRREKGRPVVVNALKTEVSERMYVLPSEVVTMLRRHRTAQAVERLSAREWADDRLVFATRVGTPLDAANVRRELARICRHAGVPVILPNELRHTAGSLAADAGVPLHEVADALGHADTRMLDATYRHRLRPVEAAPAAAMAAIRAARNPNQAEG